MLPEIWASHPVFEHDFYPVYAIGLGLDRILQGSRSSTAPYRSGPRQIALAIRVALVSRVALASRVALVSRIRLR